MGYKLQLTKRAKDAMMLSSLSATEWQSPKGETYGEDLITCFLRQHRRWGQRSHRGETHSCFLLLGEVLMRQLALVMRVFEALPCWR
jgi:hypothetical protein